MLFAKIFPEAMIASLNGPFSLETSTAQYMTAIANPYKLGDYTVNFNIYYGDFVLDESQNPIAFQVKLTNNAIIEGATVQSWGTDDTYMLEAIAIQQGTSVVEFIENDLTVSLY